MAEKENLKQTLDKLFKNNPNISSYDLESHKDITDPEEKEKVIMVGLKYNKQEAKDMGYENTKEDARKMAKDLKLPLRIDDIKVKYFFEGKITLANHDSRFMEVPIGASVGTEKSWDDDSSITGGTLFGPIFDKETGEMYLATNTHVVTNVTEGAPEHEIGDTVTQPLSYDEAYYDQVGKLKELYFADENADIALIEVDIADDAREILYGDTVEGGTIGHSPYTGNFSVGDIVETDGITTGHNEGEIISTSVTVNIETSDHWGSEFENVVRTTLPTDFGDSGARVWHKNTGDTVGIHFAGCEDYAYHCRGDMVKESCGVNFDNSPHLDVKIEEGGKVAGNGLHEIAEGKGEHTVRTDFGDAEIVAEPDEDYQFTGWSGPDLEAIEDENSTDTIIYMDRRRKIEPQFEPAKILTTQIEGQGDIKVDPYKTEYYVGDEIELEAISAKGWEFSNWQGDLVSNNRTETIIIEEDTQITAVFTDVSEYTLTVNIDGEGGAVLNPDKEKYHDGEEVEVTAVPEDKWKFLAWKGDIETSEKTATLIMNDNKEITALFVAPVDITLEPDGMGYITANEKVVENKDTLSFVQGEPVELKAVPDDVCSIFDIWEDHNGLLENVESKSSESINIFANKDGHIKAAFAIKQLDMSVWANGQGNVDVYIENKKETTIEEGNTYNFTMECGKELEIKASADAGNEFVEWRGI